MAVIEIITFNRGNNYQTKYSNINIGAKTSLFEIETISIKSDNSLIKCSLFSKYFTLQDILHNLNSLEIIMHTHLL